jgi:hypothetical protein
LPPVVSRLQKPDPVDSGHDRTRLQFGWQHEDGEDVALLGLRAAYHDMHDPQAAYQPGVQLDVLDLTLRIAGSHEDDSPGLESMRWFGVQSYSPGDVFFSESSWGFDLARERELLGDTRHLVHLAEGYRGWTHRCGALLCHAEMVGGVLLGGPLDLGWTARAGLRAGLLYQTDAWTASTDISEEKYLTGEHDLRTVWQAEIGRPLAVQTALYGSYRREENDSNSREIFTFSLRQFF